MGMQSYVCAGAERGSMVNPAVGVLIDVLFCLLLFFFSPLSALSFTAEFCERDWRGCANVRMAAAGGFCRVRAGG